MVSIETTLGAGHSGVQTVARLREFSLLQDVHSDCEDQNPPIELLMGGSIPGVKGVKLDFDNLDLSNAEVMNEWSYVSTPG